MMQIINNTGAIIGEQINLGNIDDLNIDDLFKDNTNNKKMKNNNYPTWLVPLDIAKELKEIDFNELCLFAFDTQNNGLYLIQREKKDCVWYEDISLLYEPVVPTDSFLVPTWEQVFEWFRGKGYHGIIAVIYEDGNDKYSYRIEFLDELITDFNQDNPLTYEEAREALVKALIQTYKNEQL